MQDTFAGEAGEGEGGEGRRLEAISTATSTAQKFLALNFYCKTLTHACVSKMDGRIHTYKENLDLDGARYPIKLKVSILVYEDALFMQTQPALVTFNLMSIAF